ncbi:putative FAD-dependent pyridine nucleotide-disulphide oxidoreductase protein [Agrobacterium tumefaciens str. Kerr 14]|uniref:NADH:ubiquinone reductase (non-electrogenic) n=1 Tax=Agrobacterium tumefaciens str. Kerr 14 TaxID=1183424 RepID=A0A1S7SFQ6_AGRTU|nr:NAD(P)/FAD-dependent oxidoreductase [Agrobacterium tumefaciens]CUX67765.1 putative FAD-dependent pyridine nucleotide-disulphide oxidoreductase protein [Agrobacterium tumefaciens str. Kerr 14]
MPERIVIIGGGFGGLACAQELGGSAYAVTVIDRRNHNLFQPLLYQVATAALSPADIAEPIRKTLGRYRNINMIMAEVVGIDAQRQQVQLDGGDWVGYDRLVIATGSEYNYFGKDDWRANAPGMKTIHEARQIRQRLLSSFEKAERAHNEQEKRNLLTYVVIGGGPTGVEMAGAISELGRFMINRDFRNIQPDQLRVILIEAGPRILAAFPEKLIDYARHYLEKIGVEVRTSERVLDVTSDGVTVGSEFIRTGCVVWGAGVKASPAHRWIGLDAVPGGRIPVDPQLQVVGHRNIFALGDTADFTGTDGKPLPGLAQVAKQQGIYLGRLLKNQSDDPAAFVFRNRGNTAVIGRNAAIFDFGKWTLKGRAAWFLWAFVHVYLLINFEKRILVSVQWIWRYLTRQRGARLIEEGSIGETNVTVPSVVYSATGPGGD